MHPKMSPKMDPKMVQNEPQERSLSETPPGGAQKPQTLSKPTKTPPGNLWGKKDGKRKVQGCHLPDIYLVLNECLKKDHHSLVYPFFETFSRMVTIIYTLSFKQNSFHFSMASEVCLSIRVMAKYMINCAQTGHTTNNIHKRMLTNQTRPMYKYAGRNASN